jgi:outer membrane lipoprotein-sorting protein
MAIQRARWLAAAALTLAWDLPPNQPPLKLRRSAGALAKAEGGSHVHRFVDLFDEIYRRGQAQNGDLRTFTAAFTETTTSSLLTRPLIARGTVAVERPGRVALRYVAPDDRVVIIDGDRMTLSWPSRGVQQTRDIGASQRRVRKYFVDSSPDELRGHFEVAAREAVDRPGYLVTLIPKRKQIKEGLSRLELWIDPDTLLLSAMRMSFPNRDTKLMTYTDVKPNASVAGMFEIKK